MARDTPRDALHFTPFHVAGCLFLLVGLGFALYHGLEQLHLVPRVRWMSWSHIHFVTIGGFAQLLFGMLPQLAARKMDRPRPPGWYEWLNFAGLNGAFLVVWYGRGWGDLWAFETGLITVGLLTIGLLGVVIRMAVRSDRGWNSTVALYMLSLFIFTWGLVYAWGLYGHAPFGAGGWMGLREGHVHANGWGFFGLAAIATLFDIVPRLLETDLYSDRLRTVSSWCFSVAIFPLVIGPVLGMGQTVTAPGLVLFGIGYVMYLYNLVRTYRRAETTPAIALSLVAAQFWILAPALFAPFVLFGVEWVKPAFIEDGALHFFFMGWALPIALGGLMLFGRNLPSWIEGGVGLASRVDPTDLLPDGAVPSVLSTWMVILWNASILVVGVGFLYQTSDWSAYLFGAGYTALVVLWLYQLVRIAGIRRRLWRTAIVHS